MDRETVKVYVRKEAEGERTLSFRPPKEVPHREWLERGFAIDGNSVIMSITSTTYVSYMDGGDPSTGQTHEWTPGGIAPGDWAVNWSLTKALADVQRWLVDWLDTLGYDVEFA